MSDQECSICQYHWHCPVDANGYMPCEPDYKGVADAEAKARDYVATLEPPFSTGVDMYRCPVCGVANKFRERIRETFYYNSQGDIVDKYIFPDEKILECCTCNYKAREKEFRVDYYEEQLRQARKD